jgi:putative ABC transport system substrate-binding protein
MIERIVVWLLATILLATASFAKAQPAKIYRIGYLDPTSFSAAAPFLEIFRQRLRELGWVEGKNIALEYRFGEGKANERFKELATELVQTKIDVGPRHDRNPDGKGSDINDPDCYVGRWRSCGGWTD